MPEPSENTNLKMRLHFWICAWRRRYFEQINFLHATAPPIGFGVGRIAWTGNVVRSQAVHPAEYQGWVVKLRCKVWLVTATNQRVKLFAVQWSGKSCNESAD